MTEHGRTLLQLNLPPLGRLAVAAADSAGSLPGPGLVVALEHRTPAGSQTLAGLLDRERVLQLQETLTHWLVATEMAAEGHPGAPEPVVLEGTAAGTVQLHDTATVAAWLESGADETQL